MAPSKYPGSAIISKCGTYRSELRRVIDAANPRPLVICGLNPSTADEIEDDNTILKEIKFAIRWGCGLLLKVNAYDYRHKDPEVMWSAEKSGVPIFTTLTVCQKHGIEIEKTNMVAIVEAAIVARDLGGIFLVAWGNHIDEIHQRHVDATICAIGVKAVCIKTNKNGTPIHPLYQPDASDPKPWTCPS